MALIIGGVSINELLSKRFFDASLIEGDSSIKSYILELEANNGNLNNVDAMKMFEKVIEYLRSKTPENFPEFLFYVRSSVSLLLLKDCPASLVEERITFLVHTFNCQFEGWDSDILKICNTADTIRQITTNIPDIVQVTSNIYNYNQFCRCVSLRLLSTALLSANVKNNRPLNSSQWFKYENLLSTLDSIRMEEDSDASVIRNFKYLSLYAAYQRLFLQNPVPFASNDLLRTIFESNNCDLEEIKLYLEKIKFKFHELIHKNQFMNESILINQLLEHDILSALNQSIDALDKDEPMR